MGRHAAAPQDPDEKSGSLNPIITITNKEFDVRPFRGKEDQLLLRHAADQAVCPAPPPRQAGPFQSTLTAQTFSLPSANSSKSLRPLGGNNLSYFIDTQPILHVRQAPSKQPLLPGPFRYVGHSLKRPATTTVSLDLLGSDDGRGRTFTNEAQPAITNKRNEALHIVIQQQLHSYITKPWTFI